MHHRRVNLSPDDTSSILASLDSSSSSSNETSDSDTASSSQEQQQAQAQSPASILDYLQFYITALAARTDMQTPSLVFHRNLTMQHIALTSQSDSGRSSNSVSRSVSSASCNASSGSSSAAPDVLSTDDYTRLLEARANGTSTGTARQSFNRVDGDADDSNSIEVSSPSMHETLQSVSAQGAVERIITLDISSATTSGALSGPQAVGWRAFAPAPADQPELAEQMQPLVGSNMMVDFSGCLAGLYNQFDSSDVKGSRRPSDSLVADSSSASSSSSSSVGDGDRDADDVTVMDTLPMLNITNGNVAVVSSPAAATGTDLSNGAGAANATISFSGGSSSTLTGAPGPSATSSGGPPDSTWYRSSSAGGRAVDPQHNATQAQPAATAQPTATSSLTSSSASSGNSTSYDYDNDGPGVAVLGPAIGGAAGGFVLGALLAFFFMRRRRQERRRLQQQRAADPQNRDDGDEQEAQTLRSRFWPFSSARASAPISNSSSSAPADPAGTQPSTAAAATTGRRRRGEMLQVDTSPATLGRSIMPTYEQRRYTVAVDPFANPEDDDDPFAHPDDDRGEAEQDGMMGVPPPEYAASVRSTELVLPSPAYPHPSTTYNSVSRGTPTTAATSRTPGLTRSNTTATTRSVRTPATSGPRSAVTNANGTPTTRRFAVTAASTLLEDEKARQHRLLSPSTPSRQHHHRSALEADDEENGEDDEGDERGYTVGSRRASVDTVGTVGTTRQVLDAIVAEAEDAEGREGSVDEAEFWASPHP